jgi:hypothetical protein
MDEQKYFSIEQTAKFFGVDEPTIHGWLKRTELVAKLRGNQLMIGTDAIADMIQRMPERTPTGVALGVNRVARLRRISTCETRRVPLRDV